MKLLRQVCLLLALFLSFCFVSCKDQRRAFSTCENGHSLKAVALVAPTCDSNGMAAHSECTRCHKLFDTDGNRLSIEELTLPAACTPDGVWVFDEEKHWQTCLVCNRPTLAEKHLFDEGVCRVCSAYEAGVCQHRGGKATCLEKAVCELCGKQYGGLGSHEKVFVVAKEYLASEATCTRRASYHASCALCDFVFAETFTDGNPLGHTGNATCLEAAVCERCGTLYGPIDEHDFSLEIASSQTLLSPASCSRGALYYKTCSVCGKIGTETFVLGGPVPENHSFDVDEEHTDETAHRLVCRLCGEVLTEPHTSDRPGSCVDFALCTICGHACPASPHDFSMKNTAPKYLASPATDTSPATYFYSCKYCSAIGTETFFDEP